MTNGNNKWSSTLSYTYDKNGNIETISEDGTLIVTYHYDALNQLVREDNTRAARDANGNWLQKTIVYTYDNGGNLLKFTEHDYTTADTVGTVNKTVYHGHSSTSWNDRLIVYNNKGITYDTAGNPTKYYTLHGTTAASLQAQQKRAETPLPTSMILMA